MQLPEQSLLRPNISQPTYDGQRTQALEPELLVEDSNYILRLIHNPISYFNCANDFLVKVNDIYEPRKRLVIINLVPHLIPEIKLNLLPVTQDGTVINHLEKINLSVDGSLLRPGHIGLPAEIGYLLSAIDERDLAVWSILNKAKQ